MVGLGTVFLSEFVGTGVLILLGVGVVANVSLGQTYGNDGGTLMVNFGWGLAVFAGVFAGATSGAHLNPAVTIGLLTSGADEYAPGVAVTFGATVVYVLAQLTGAFTGAVLAWAAYRQHYDEPTVDGASKRGTFCTAAAIRSPVDNVVTEIIATFVLVYIVLRFGDTPTEIGPLAVALLVVGIGASLGGPTGYAINPARDLGPRLAHQILPIKGKTDGNWGYSWVPVVGPLIGGAVAGLFAHVSI